MADDDKPFACTISGCGMRFTNEDRLTVHTQKHEMSLALADNPSSGSSSRGLFSLFPADQTPTPTKFIRNCEEMGLFNELKNPFEESFKKAIGDDGVLSLPGPSADTHMSNETPTVTKDFNVNDNCIIQSGDMPTPETVDKFSIQVINKPINSTRASTNTDMDPLSISATHVNVTPRFSSIESISTISPSGDSATRPISLKTSVASSTESQTSGLTPQNPFMSGSFPMQVVLQLPSGQAIPVQIPTLLTKVHTATVPTAIQPATTANVSSTSTTSLAKQKLKEALTQQAHQQAESRDARTVFTGNMHIMTEAVERVTSQRGIVNITAIPSTSHGELTQSAAVDSTVPVRKRHRSSTEDGDDSPDERRRRFLERNRAAAARCRTKKKSWVHQLEKKAEDLQGVNSKLQSEVTNLRSEVAQLKSLLLAHKDCPITQQQKDMGQVEIKTIEIVQPGMPRTEAHIITAKAKTL